MQMIEAEVDVRSLLDISRSHSSAASAVSDAILMLEMELKAHRFHIVSGSLTYALMRRDLPYAIYATSIPNTYILVNRKYKPLGSNLDSGGTFTKYENFTNLHVQLTHEQMTRVATQVDDHYFLFGDPPWNGRNAALDYLGRLKTLREILRQT